MHKLNVNELRLGNYVNYEQTIHYITLVDRLGFIETRYLNQDINEEDYRCSIGTINPIILTEQLLEQLGFIRSGYDLLFWKHSKIKEEFAGINWADKDIPEYQFLNFLIDGKIIQIHYVHQLQNLFYVLTNEELVLKYEKKQE